MKIIRNNIIPFKGFTAINLFGIIFIRKDTYVDFNTLVHESIHTAQMKEMLYLPFYLWYLIEWLIRLFINHKAYENISFEREAYANELSPEYLERRKRFAWIKYINKNK